MKLIDALSSNPVKGAILFAVIAPPLGAFVLCALGALPFLLIAIMKQNPEIIALISIVVFMVPIYSYIFGAIPAIITGYIVGMRRSMLSTRYGPLLSGAIGALVTTFMLTIIIILRSPDATSILHTLDRKWEILPIYGLCAFIGGTGAGYIFRMQPNNSFKRTAASKNE
jgi:hypothetical protein